MSERTILAMGQELSTLVRRSLGATPSLEALTPVHERVARKMAEGLQQACAQKGIAIEADLLESGARWGCACFELYEAGLDWLGDKNPSMEEVANQLLASFDESLNMASWVTTNSEGNPEPVVVWAAFEALCMWWGDDYEQVRKSLLEEWFRPAA